MAYIFPDYIGPYPEGEFTSRRYYALRGEPQGRTTGQDGQHGFILFRSKDRYSSISLSMLSQISANMGGTRLEIHFLLPPPLRRREGDGFSVILTGRNLRPIALVLAERHSRCCIETYDRSKHDQPEPGAPIVTRIIVPALPFKCEGN